MITIHGVVVLSSKINQIDVEIHCLGTRCYTPLISTSNRGSGNWTCKMSQPSPFLIRSTNHLRFLALAASQPSPSHCQPRPTSALKRPNPQRYLSSSSPLRSSSAASEQTPVSEPSASQSRWLSNTKSRLGKCILWGLTPDQTQRAAKVLKVLGEDWRALVAEQEGFLTSEKRAGLLRHKVVWGEMDSMVCQLFFSTLRF